MSALLFCPLVSQHLPHRSMASPRTTSTQSYLISSTVSGCSLLLHTKHVPILSIPLCVWSTLLVMSITLESFSCGKKLTGPYSGAQRGCAWSCLTPRPHSFSMVMPSLGMKLSPTLSACPATEKPVCSMYYTLAHPSVRETTLGICHPEPCGIHDSM